MGRVKLEIKKIPNHTNRQVTFSKRRNGLIKKAYELCVLSNIDLALIMFSPSGRLVAFSGRRRIEDVLIRYLNLPEEEILSGLACPRRDGGVVLENREALIGILNRLKHEDESAFSQTNETVMKTDEEIIEEITQEISLLHEQLESAEEELSTFEPDPLDITSLEELESLEQKILKMLSCIRERKEYLLNNQASSSSYDPYLQEKLLPFENGVFTWVPEDGQSHATLSNEYVTSIPERDLPSTGFYAMLQGTGSNMDPESIMEEEVVFHLENENPSVSWKYPYASPYSNASHMETAHNFQPPLQSSLTFESVVFPQLQTNFHTLHGRTHEEQEHSMEGMLQSQAEIYSQALQHEREELDMGSMPSGQAETFSEQFQHEEEDQRMWSIQQGQTDRFLPPLQDEDGQSKGATPQGQPEILLSPHQKPNDYISFMRKRKRSKAQGQHRKATSRRFSPPQHHEEHRRGRIGSSSTSGMSARNSSF